MWHIVKIFSFAWTYLRPYRGRLFLGILASVIYAASSGGFVWLTRAFTGRFKPAEWQMVGVSVTNYSITTIAITNDLVTQRALTNYFVSTQSVTNATSALPGES